MLQKIRSTYFYKKIFIHIDDKIKLDLLKYNKSLQKQLDISLNDYRIFSGKYIIYEGKGKGKIYNGYSHKLIFEGELLNGKKNGIGIEYDERGNIKYSGEYSNDKMILQGNEFKNGFEYQYNNNHGIRNGKGKDYFYNGKVKYDGEYYYGKKWSGFGYDMNNNIVYELKKGKGNIKEYNDYQLIFEGEYLNGLRNGKGKEYHYNGKVLFEGEYLNDKKIGKGKEYDSNGNLIFEGEYKFGHRLEGKEYNNSGNLLYEGEYLYGLRSGKGKEYDHNGNLIFEGDYLYGLRSGKGKEYDYKGKVIFEGDYLNGLRNGKGKEYNDNGNLIFEGEYMNDLRHGKGEEFNKLHFEGEYIFGHKFKGKEYINEKLEFEGEYIFKGEENINVNLEYEEDWPPVGKYHDDKNVIKFNGKGYDKKGNVIYELINGNGKVKEYNNSGNLIFEGEYLNGLRNGKGKEYNYDGKLLFKGEYLNGKKWNGNGQEYVVVDPNCNCSVCCYYRKYEYLFGQKIY